MHASPPSATRRAVCLGLAAATLGPRSSWAQAGDDWTTLVAAPRSVRLRPEPAGPASLWSFNDQDPGLTLRVKQGEELRLRIENKTDRPLAFHLLGLRGPNASDGVAGLTQEPIRPGATGEIRVAPPDAGTFLLRPSVLGGSSEPAERGLHALVVVEEREPPAVDRDVALLVDDWKLGDDGALTPFGAVAEASTGGRLGNWLTVNGRAVPLAINAPAGSRLRLRLANASNARVMTIRFDGLKASVAAIDSQPTDTFEPLRSTLPFPPGRRYDLMIEAPSDEGATGALVALVGQGAPLATVRTTSATSAPARPALAGLRDPGRLPAEIRLQNALRRELTIDGGARRMPDGQVRYEGDPARIWTINGVAGTVGMPPLFKVARGTPVALTLNNKTPGVQPFHLHGHMFRLLHNLDDGWEPYWLDTLQVPEGRTSRIAFVADNPGRWLFASTVLERADTGLWTWFEVA